ncbi:MAG: ThiF family adenylyltransferase [Candidatus Helarchaeota archaeon]
MKSERHERQRRLWGIEGESEIQKTSVLLAGAGGIGSEVGKNLALLGIKKIMIVDLDRIELSNLNRQVFFREEDIGAAKAEVLAQALKKLNPNIDIQYRVSKVQLTSKEVFNEFSILISALDNIAARVFLNMIAVRQNKPLIDGGAEGFLGHVQVFLPKITPCLACHNLWVPPSEPFKCTYAVSPRTPLDCALEARDQFLIANDRLPNPDDDEDLNLLYDFALAHAKKHGIIGVTREHVKFALKGSVAQIVTTNAMIGAMMVNEFIKIVLKNTSKFSELELQIQTFIQFNGTTGACWSVPLERNKDCSICGREMIPMITSPDLLLIQFLEKLNEIVGTPLNYPMLVKDSRLIFRKSPSFKNQLLENQFKPISELFQQNDVIYVKDEGSGFDFRIQIHYEEIS